MNPLRLFGSLLRDKLPYYVIVQIMLVFSWILCYWNFNRCKGTTGTSVILCVLLYIVLCSARPKHCNRCDIDHGLWKFVQYIRKLSIHLFNISIDIIFIITLSMSILKYITIDMEIQKRYEKKNHITFFLLPYNSTFRSSIFIL